jgi:hypothetical protein
MAQTSARPPVPPDLDNDSSGMRVFEKLFPGSAGTKRPPERAERRVGPKRVGNMDFPSAGAGDSHPLTMILVAALAFV